MNAIFQLDLFNLAYFFAAIFAASFAIPTGALIIIVTFASAADGWSDVFILIFLSLLATISGDFSAYLLLKKFRQKINAKIKNISWAKNKIIFIEHVFDKYGTHTVFFTRFFLSGIGPYVNFYSGLHNMPWRKFLKAVIAGEIIYCFFYVLVGYFFRVAWQEIIIIVRDYTAFAILALLGLYVISRIVKLIKKTKIKTK